MNTQSLGVAGIVTHDKKLTEEYNELLNKIGVENMLIEFERYIDHENLVDLINQIKENYEINS